MGDDLVVFLAARLDEDEAAAKAAEGRPEFDGTGIVIQRNQGGDRSVVMPSHVATHIARHNPARVLREVEAKRAIVAEHPVQAELLAWSLKQDRVKAGETPPISWCDRCKIPVPDAREDEDQYEQVDWPCPTLRHLAAVYSDHPDYRGEWKP